MNITEENIKDLEVVLGLAISSEYLDSSNDKACDRVEKLIEALKQVKNDDLLHSVSGSFNLEIKDRDIATVEALHDVLLDEKILGLNARSMKESRDLTQRMYKALYKD